MGMMDTPEWPGRIEYRRRDPKEYTDGLGRILKEGFIKQSESYISRP
jgi:hypothetical protein